MTTTALDIDGFTAPGWLAVREAFAGTFTRHGDAGAAVCVYQNGRPVADLAAGVTAGGRPYTRGTIQPFMSVSKGIVAVAANMLADQGMLDLDAPVARYWPEFAQAGKGTIPVRWLLTHQAGLAALDRPLSRAELLSWTPGVHPAPDPQHLPLRRPPALGRARPRPAPRLHRRQRRNGSCPLR